MDDLQLRRALDFDGALHTDVYDGVGADLGWDELVAGVVYDLARQHDRARSDIAQFTSGYEVRHPVPRVCTGGVWNGWVESSGLDEGDRRMRLVRHTGVDRRAGFADVFCSIYSGLGDLAWRAGQRSHADGVAFVRNFLGHEYRHYLQGNGPVADRRELGGSVCVDNDRITARVDIVSSGRSWFSAQ